jgi:kynurenine formamidase
MSSSGWTGSASIMPPALSMWTSLTVIENLGLGLKEVLGKRVRVAAAPFRIKEGDASPIAPLAMID